MNIIIRAAMHAHWWHKGQTRKFHNEPYIVHPMRVAGRMTLYESPFPFFNDNEIHENAIAAAWLHDVIEDCNITQETLSLLFNDNVAQLVGELTNPSKGSKRPRAERKAMDREHIAGASYLAKVIKLLDRIDNVSDMKSSIKFSSDRQFFNLYKDETFALLTALAGTDKELEKELMALITDD